nr:inorganic diphosphatase [Calditrichia bacterium]
IGGLRMLDGDEADDKIIAVLQNDNYWGEARDISDLPGVITERLYHYFSTYKLIPGEDATQIFIDEQYGAEKAYKVIQAAMADYEEEYGG